MSHGKRRIACKLAWWWYHCLIDSLPVDTSLCTEQLHTRQPKGLHDSADVLRRISRQRHVSPRSLIHAGTRASDLIDACQRERSCCLA
jgi:hypothetical protein